MRLHHCPAVLHCVVFEIDYLFWRGDLKYGLYTRVEVF